MTLIEDYNAGLAKKKLHIIIFFLLFIVVFMSAPEIAKVFMDCLYH